MGKYFKKVRVYVFATSLFAITGYTGADPEVRFNDINASSNGQDFSRSTPDGLTQGVDRFSTYLPTRTFSFGVNFGF